MIIRKKDILLSKLAILVRLQFLELEILKKQQVRDFSQIPSLVEI